MLSQSVLRFVHTTEQDNAHCARRQREGGREGEVFVSTEVRRFNFLMVGGGSAARQGAKAAGAEQFQIQRRKGGTIEISHLLYKVKMTSIFGG